MKASPLDEADRTVVLASHSCRRPRLAGDGLPLAPSGVPLAGPGPDSAAETAVLALFRGLTEAQKQEICFPWNYHDERRGQLRTFVSNHWYVTRPFIRSHFFTKEQQAIIHDIFTALINPEWYGRFLKQMKDDTYGQDWGEEQSIAIFGTPGTGPFQFILTGRHMTLRADGGSERQMAFGGPIVYGHAADGYVREKPHHPGNVFWYQAEVANKVYQLLDPVQRQHALVVGLPRETDVEFRQPGFKFPGIPVASLYEEQKAALGQVLQALLDPFRVEDQVRTRECLQKQGGLDRCHLAFYREANPSDAGLWDNWRLEGPAFVWYFRGSPHVHVWVNVADTPSIPLNAQVRQVTTQPFQPIRLESRQAAGSASTGKLVAISSVKNEIDIIEPFVRHTLAFVDHLAIVDNGSTDGTLNILRALEHEGLPVSITEDPSVGNCLSPRMTWLMREVAVGRHGADWVVPLDASEFLVVPQGTALIPEAVSSDATVSLPWRTYVPDESDDPTRRNPVLRIRHRLVQEGMPWGKVAVPRKLATCADAVLTEGNHQLCAGGQPCRTDTGQAWLAHFPIRGSGQYLGKVAISMFQSLTMGTPAAGLANHWQAAYDLLKHDLDAFAVSTVENARRFAVPSGAVFEPATVLDPLPYRGGPLLHTDRVDDRARGWHAVLAYTEHLARRYAALTGGLTPQELLTQEQQLSAFMNSGDEAKLGTPLLLKGHLELRRKQEALQQQLQACQEVSERLGVELDRSSLESSLLRAELEQSQHHLQAMRNSWTWKVGTLIVRPASRALAWVRHHRI